MRPLLHFNNGTEKNSSPEAQSISSDIKEGGKMRNLLKTRETCINMLNMQITILKMEKMFMLLHKGGSLDP